MIKRRGGRIIGPSSRNGKQRVVPNLIRVFLLATNHIAHQGMPDGIAYSNTKLAIRELTQATGEFTIFHSLELLSAHDGYTRSIGTGSSPPIPCAWITAVRNSAQNMCRKSDESARQP